MDRFIKSGVPQFITPVNRRCEVLGIFIPRSLMIKFDSCRSELIKINSSDAIKLQINKEDLKSMENTKTKSFWLPNQIITEKNSHIFHFLVKE
jgi:hypothetical protein